jgi:hypothetical protein
LVNMLLFYLQRFCDFSCISVSKISTSKRLSIVDSIEHRAKTSQRFGGAKSETCCFGDL